MALKQRIREIAQIRTRYGHLRIHALLRREGWPINHKRVYRLYCEMGLQMRHKTPRRRVKAKLREDRQPAQRSNECWSMDFMADQTFDGKRLRVLTIVDNFSRVSPAIGVRYRYTGCDVVRTLEQATRRYGTPKTIRVDNVLPMEVKPQESNRSPLRAMARIFRGSQRSPMLAVSA